MQNLSATAAMMSPTAANPANHGCDVKKLWPDSSSIQSILRALHFFLVFMRHHYRCIDTINTQIGSIKRRRLSEHTDQLVPGCVQHIILQH